MSPSPPFETLEPVPFPPGSRGTCPVPVDLPDHELLESSVSDLWAGGGEEDAEEQPACCGCLQPAGPVPIRVWRTTPGEDGQEQVTDEWAVCGDCIRKRTAAGMTLQQALADVVGARAHVP